jgi:hypothetical protein
MEQRELTGTEVRWIAEGCWKRHFTTHWYSKMVPWLVVAFIALAASLPTAFLAANAMPVRSDVVNVERGSVSVTQGYWGTIVIRQNEKELPKLSTFSGDKSLGIAYFAFAIIFLLCLTIALGVAFAVVNHAKTRYLDLCVDEWEGGEHNIPSETTLVAFLTRS